MKSKRLKSVVELQIALLNRKTTICFTGKSGFYVSYEWRPLVAVTVTAAREEVGSSKIKSRQVKQAQDFYQQVPVHVQCETKSELFSDLFSCLGMRMSCNSQWVSIKRHLKKTFGAAPPFCPFFY